MQVSAVVVRALLAVAFAVVAALGVIAMDDSWLLPGASSDSVSYLEAAESLAHGGTLGVPIAPWNASDSIVPLTHYPPGLPLILAGGIRLGLRPHVSALWTIALGAALAMALAVWIVDVVGGPFAASLAGALFLLDPALIQLHLAVWSEPIYIALVLALVWMIARHPRASWLHGTLSALALSVRYVGVTATGVAVLWAVIQRCPAVRRLRSAAGAALPSLVATAWWLWRPHESAPVRVIGYYPGILRELAAVPAVPLRWFGGGLGGVGAPLALIAALVLLLLGWRRAKREGGLLARLVGGGALYCLLHVGVVLAARMVADPAIPLDTRILAPVLVLVTLGVVIGITEVFQGAQPVTTVTLVLALGAWGFTAATEVRAGVAIAQAQGRYFTDAGWVSDAVIWWLDNRSRPWPVVYSNEPALVKFHTGRAARTLPRVGESISAFADTLRQRPGPIVIALPLHAGDLGGATWLQCLDLEVAASSPRALALIPKARTDSVEPSHLLLPTCPVERGGTPR